MAADNSGPHGEMHVFGASQGESIVLKLPTGGWGVVDCYSRSLTDDSKNPVCQYLVERQVTQLDFLCLTHPHEDHYRGMSQILRCFDVREFWQPATMNDTRLRWILSAAMASADETGLPEDSDNTGELVSIYKLVREQRVIRRNATLGTQLYPVPLDTDNHANFQIWAFAPSGEQIYRYENELHRCFDEKGRVRQPVPYLHHNTASMGLLVIFGETRLILGGDVEADGWKDAMRDFGSNRLSAAAVKISHHGSTNGYCDDLWAILSRQRQPLSVVTPFRRYGLPSHPALLHINDFAGQILTPCVPAVGSGNVRLSIHAAPGSRAALAKTWKNLSYSDLCPIGRCTFEFDDAGNCRCQPCEKPAGVITI